LKMIDTFRRYQPGQCVQAKLTRTALTTAIALAMGSASTGALALQTDAVLNFDPGLCADGSVATQTNNCYYSPPVSSGSYFAMDGNGDGELKEKERVGITRNNGITLGVIQPASGSHAGAPDGSETPNIDLPWNFFGNTGMHQSTSAVVELSDDGAGNLTLDFSGWDVTWNGIASIPMGGDTANFPSDTGVATLTCADPTCADGTGFTLDYNAHVPLGDPSNFGGVLYGLHMEGLISAPGGATTTVTAAVLPSSRSVEVNTPATAFATIINSGTADATGCGITPSSTPVIPATFLYQTTDPSNNLTGSANTPADIAAGAQQNYLIAITPSGAFDPTDLAFEFDCAETDPAAVVSGLNTLLISASDTPIADIVALAATINNDGYTDIPGDTGTGVFAVAAVNVGSTDTITASSVLSDPTLPVTVSLCETDAAGACLAAPTPTVTTNIANGATPSFAAFVTGSATVADDPAANRITVQFEDGGPVVRGATSVAVRTVTP
jgi:hypothetical protein